MDEFFRSAPQIIEAAAKNPLGLTALVILSFSVLALLFFRDATELTRVVIYVLTGVAILTLVTVVFVMTTIQTELSDFRETLGPAKTPVSDSQTAELSKDELLANQKALQTQLEEMKRKMEEKETAIVNSGVSRSAKIITNLSGVWHDRNTGGSYTFSQSGSDIAFEEHSTAFGMDVVSATGSGTISGHKVELNYTTLFNTNGKASMLLSPNNEIMSGSSHDLTSGAMIQITLSR
jgi:low affinity Fe/Cu permease